MIPRNVEPIGHVPPYKRVDLNPLRRPTAEPSKSFADVYADNIAEARRKARADIIWKITKQTAEGTNMPTAAPEVAPDPPAEVCEDGWFAA
jgi:hypothetical protein